MTTHQLLALKPEATRTGDDALVALCDLALDPTAEPAVINGRRWTHTQALVKCNRILAALRW